MPPTISAKPITNLGELENRKRPMTMQLGAEDLHRAQQCEGAGGLWPSAEGFGCNGCGFEVRCVIWNGNLDRKGSICLGVENSCADRVPLLRYKPELITPIRRSGWQVPNSEQPSLPLLVPKDSSTRLYVGSLPGEIHHAGGFERDNCLLLLGQLNLEPCDSTFQSVGFTPKVTIRTHEIQGNRNRRQGYDGRRPLQPAKPGWSRLRHRYCVSSLLHEPDFNCRGRTCRRHAEGKQGHCGLKFFHFSLAHHTLILVEMTRVLQPLAVGHGAGSVEAGPFLKVIREFGVLHTHKYGRNRFLRCIIPVRIRSFTVPNGWPRAAAISV